MAAIDFFSHGIVVENLSGSGLGFYGTSFGSSVQVGAYQNSTFITDGNGTEEGPQVDNLEWVHPDSGSINGLGAITLRSIPNMHATLNPRFTHGSAVQVQNVKARIYDRTNIDNPATGVTTQVAELIHIDNDNDDNGSGDLTWIEITPINGGNGTIVDLANSPGEEGLFAGNGEVSTRADTQHDWYIALSASPDSIGSKTLYGFYIELEFL